MKLPLTVDEVDVSWLNHALGQSVPGVRVRAIEDRRIIWGSGTKILLRLAYEDNGHSRNLPTDICVKGGFNEEIRYIAAPNYLLEAGFYGDVAKQLTLPLPRCWYAKAEPKRGQGIIILENLTSAGATFGSLGDTWDTDKVANALDVLARLHGQTWGATQQRFPSLPIGAPLRHSARVMLTDDYWQHHFSLATSPVLPAPLQDRDRVYRALFKMWEYDDATPERCVAHSDAHIGNTYVDAAGRLGFLDWQIVCLASHMDDVANVIVCALPVAERRAQERALLQHYLDALAGNGGPRRAFDDAWLDYRRFHMHGMFWAICPESMQPWQKVHVVTERHMAAIMDHDTLNLLN